MYFHNHSVVAFLAVSLVAACNASSVHTSALKKPSVDVQPSSTQAEPGGLVQFSASVTGSIDPGVDWSIQEGAAGGSIDSAGKYQAPLTVGTYTVLATSRADPSQRGSALVAVESNSTPSQGCAIAPLRTSGTVYYYCDCQSGANSACQRGDNANSGTSPSAPRRTLADAESRFGGMQAGDTVALCRGGAWAESSSFSNNSRCTKSNPCDFRDYVPSWGSASTPRPLLNVGTSTFASMDLTGHQEGYRFWNLDIRFTAPNSAAAFLFYDDISDVDVCGCSVTNASLGVNVNSESGVGSGIVIRNSQFRSSGFAAVFGGAPGLVIDSNVFENNGLGDSWTHGIQTDHTIYLGGTSYTADSGMRVINNDMVTDNRCGGVMFVMHGTLDDVLVENNRIKAVGNDINCFAFQMASSAAPWTQFNNPVIRRNRFIGNGVTEAFHVEGAQNGLVEDNIIVGRATIADGDSSSGMSCIPPGQSGNNGNSICSTDHLVMRNNSIYGSNLTFGARTVAGQDVFANNAIWTDGGSAIDGSGSPGAVQVNNATRRSGGAAATAWWVNAAGGDFTPAGGGALAGAGSSTYYSPTAIGTVNWSPTDSGVSRATPIDIGAMAR